VTHARNAAVEVVYLVSGDDDLAEAVEEAQAHGVQVTILAIPAKHGAPHGVSRHLQGVADGLDLLSAKDLDSTVTLSTTAVQPPAPAASTPDAAPTRGPVPPPALLASRAPATRPVYPAPPEVAPDPSTHAASGLVYSSSTNAEATIATTYLDPDAHAQAIDQVVRRVLRTWLDGRTGEQRTALLASRPSIPREVDRALLRDLSDALT
jgi:hypothetical protein